MNTGREELVLVRRSDLKDLISEALKDFFEIRQITKSEAARMLGVSHSTIINWLNRGMLKKESTGVDYRSILDLKYKIDKGLIKTNVK
jgi:DNA invertase Pin-like site-specific DNA recombinase